MKLKTLLLLSVSVVSNYLTAHNGDLLDSLIKAKVNEYGIKSIVIKLEKADTTYLHEIKKFDRHGNTIDYITPNGTSFDRIGFRFDSLNRKAYFFSYAKEDTSQVISETKYIYIDSNNYYTEHSSLNNPLYEINTYSYKVRKDTFWVEHIEKRPKYNKENKTISRYTFVGDSLQISEFIRFDSEGKMDEIDAYYQLRKKDTSGNVIVTGGQYIVTSSSIENITLQDYYENQEKYLQNQLDGKYAYEYAYDVHTYKVYNSKGQLIQEGNQSFDKKTFEYNSAGQLTKTIHWSTVEDCDGIVEVLTEEYSYDERGLPISIQRKNRANQIFETYRYEYK